RQLRGLSVTAPWKGTMAALCQRLDEEAMGTGVVNTMITEAHGVLAGHNTDVAGVKAALEKVVSREPSGRSAVVLGTGGAARGGVVALLQMGFAVTMLGRSLEPAREFAKAHGVRLGSLGLHQITVANPAVVVHATPVGSAGRDVDERLIEGYRPAPGTVVLDMVYQPFHTRLLRDAIEAGAIAVPGVEMFLGQAAAQVRLFTGATVEPATLRACLAGTVVAPE
ncbi:MAG: bifunctional shikimate kinase/shikimate dehydrogenase, partial [Planctomycetota bacterium]